MDGFNLAYVVNPGTFEDVVEYLVPELRRRGRVWDRYPEGTLRERLSGSSTVPEWHPAHAYRGAYADRPSVLDLTDGPIPEPEPIPTLAGSAARADN